MILLDANVLLYAYDESAAHHRKVRAWLTHQMRQREIIGLPWISLWAFLRIATNSRIQRSPLTLAEALGIVEEIRQIPRAVVVDVGHQHAELLKQLALAGQAAGARVTDAVLAALAVEQGAILASTDRDFARFPALKWVNPLD